MAAWRTPIISSLRPSSRTGEAGTGGGAPSLTLPLRGRGFTPFPSRGGRGWGWALLLGLALLSGCGKKGPLVPPEALVPAPVADLALAQKGGRFEVSWSAPTREVGGTRLTDLAGFLLFKRTLLPPSEDCEACPNAYPAPTRIDLEYPGKVRRIGNSFIVDDYDLSKGKSYQYKVRSFTSDGAQSRDSNLARRTAVAPPLPPVLEALPSASAVVLAFVALPPEEGALIGYNVYRSKVGAPLPLAPLNAAPVTGTTYEDKGVLIGERYSYSVTSLAKVGEDIVESAPSNVVEGTLVERD